eukprot:TRINITY_DN7375_c0_g1_i2.p1 TRINITY_DN7375_c0_g1~~TRINITY_DN7375_c0_g1_i2.p1  ORF type:complete len:557 (+),score=112.87 TRINITY_DN7375_c0_g1_i2:107-1777(+)
MLGDLALLAAAVQKDQYMQSQNAKIGGRGGSRPPNGAGATNRNRLQSRDARTGKSRGPSTTTPAMQHGRRSGSRAGSRGRWHSQWPCRATGSCPSATVQAEVQVTPCLPTPTVAELKPEPTLVTQVEQKEEEKVITMEMEEETEDGESNLLCEDVGFSIAGFIGDLVEVAVDDFSFEALLDEGIACDVQSCVEPTIQEASPQQVIQLPAASNLSASGLKLSSKSRKREFCPRPAAIQIPEEPLPVDCLSLSAGMPCIAPSKIQEASKESSQDLQRSAADAFAALWAAAIEEAALAIQHSWRERCSTKAEAKDESKPAAKSTTSVLTQEEPLVPQPPTSRSAGSPRKRPVGYRIPAPSASSTVEERPAPQNGSLDKKPPAAPSEPRPARASSRPRAAGIATSPSTASLDNGTGADVLIPSRPAGAPPSAGSRRPARHVQQAADSTTAMVPRPPATPRSTRPGTVSTESNVTTATAQKLLGPLIRCPSPGPKAPTAMELDCGQTQLTTSTSRLNTFSPDTSDERRFFAAMGTGLLPTVAKTDPRLAQSADVVASWSLE